MLDFHLDTLTVVKKADLVGRDEPLIWTLFIELSIETLNTHQFVIKTDPIAGRLAKAGKGDTVAIPAAAGRYTTSKDGVFYIAVIAIAFDNDLRTNNQIRDGYNAAAAALNQVVLDHFASFGFAEFSDEEIAAAGEKMKDAIVAAFLERSIFLTALGGKPVGGDSHKRVLSADHLDEALKLEFHAKKDRAVYEVNGRLKFDRPAKRALGKK